MSAAEGTDASLVLDTTLVSFRPDGITFAVVAVVAFATLALQVLLTRDPRCARLLPLQLPCDLARVAGDGSGRALRLTAASAAEPVRLPRAPFRMDSRARRHVDARPGRDRPAELRLQRRSLGALRLRDDHRLHRVGTAVVRGGRGHRHGDPVSRRGGQPRRTQSTSSRRGSVPCSSFRRFGSSAHLTSSSRSGCSRR